MPLPLSEQQCFFVAILAFAVIGFQRGWRRESLTLVFVLLAFVLIQPASSRAIGTFLGRIPAGVGYITTGTGSTAATTTPADFLGGAFGSLLIFAGLVGLGYYLGNRAFPKPALPQDRFIGVVPAVISGGFILNYLSQYLPKNTAGQPYVAVNVPAPDATNMVPVIFVVAIVSVVIALIVARAKKAQPGPGKK
ncbi:MAG TPA: hypothetical protein VFB12_22765 [Ktedonobacteraceae bacterium]|nr:hypothetical protein [Ktedonobacteraceae bacterium]